MMKTGGIFSHTAENVVKLNQLINGNDIVHIYAERKLHAINSTRKIASQERETRKKQQ